MSPVVAELGRVVQAPFVRGYRLLENVVSGLFTIVRVSMSVQNLSRQPMDSRKITHIFIVKITFSFLLLKGSRKKCVFLNKLHEYVRKKF